MQDAGELVKEQLTVSLGQCSAAAMGIAGKLQIDLEAAEEGALKSFLGGVAAIEAADSYRSAGDKTNLCGTDRYAGEISPRLNALYGAGVAMAELFEQQTGTSAGAERWREALLG